jgi:hypothetical protein
MSVGVFGTALRAWSSAKPGRESLKSGALELKEGIWRD